MIYKSKIEIEEIRAEQGDDTADLLLAKKLHTTSGFYQQYFDELPTSRTREEAFNRVNYIYFGIFGEYRYTDYSSFSHCVKRLRKD